MTIDTDDARSIGGVKLVDCTLVSPFHPGFTVADCKFTTTPRRCTSCGLDLDKFGMPGPICDTEVVGRFVDSALAGMDKYAAADAIIRLFEERLSRLAETDAAIGSPKEGT